MSTLWTKISDEPTVDFLTSGDGQFYKWAKCTVNSIDETNAMIEKYNADNNEWKEMIEIPLTDSENVIEAICHDSILNRLFVLVTPKKLVIVKNISTCKCF